MDLTLYALDCAQVAPVLSESTKQPEDLVAYVVGADGAPDRAALRALRDALATRLPDYAVPAYWVSVTITIAAKSHDTCH